MAELRQVLTDAGYGHVRTALQSGNIIFEAPEAPRNILTNAIEQRLEEEFGFPISVHLRLLSEVEALVQRDPFRDVAITPELRCCVLFVDTPLPSAAKLPIRSATGDVIVLDATAGEIFLVLQLVNGRPADATRLLTELYHGRSVTATMRYFSALVKTVAKAHA